MPAIKKPPPGYAPIATAFVAAGIRRPLVCPVVERRAAQAWTGSMPAYFLPRNSL
jgi:hypothetical protein